MGKSAHVKKGDEVVVIAGSDKGKRGRVIAVLTKKNRIMVEGAAMVKRHTRKNQNNPQGAIVDKEGSLHISNVVSAAIFDARAQKKGAPAAATK